MQSVSWFFQRNSTSDLKCHITKIPHNSHKHSHYTHSDDDCQKNKLLIRDFVTQLNLLQLTGTFTAERWHFSIFKWHIWINMYKNLCTTQFKVWSKVNEAKYITLYLMIWRRKRRHTLHLQVWCISFIHTHSPKIRAPTGGLVSQRPRFYIGWKESGRSSFKPKIPAASLHTQG